MDIILALAPIVGALVVHLVMTGSPKASPVTSKYRLMPPNTRR